tara:strand:- start:539 stop:796 length:258 start_codon:yes stop_codon:yes gene_type:complete
MKNENEITKEQHVQTFIKRFVAIEEAMEPFKDQKRDLRGNYDENGWLSKQEIRMAIKAYRLLKTDTDMNELVDYFGHLKKTVGKQ